MNNSDKGYSEPFTVNLCEADDREVSQSSDLGMYSCALPPVILLAYFYLTQDLWVGKVAEEQFLCDAYTYNWNLCTIPS